MTVVLRDAVDQAMLNHQKKALPRHFTTDAFILYPKEYAQSARVNRFLAGKALQRKIAGMTMGQREEWKRLKLAQSRDRAAHRKIAKSLPLFETGRLNAAVVEGSPKHKGPVRSRSMTLQVPFYTFFNPPGQIHKVRALEAINSAEEEEFANIIDQILDEYINQ